MIIAEQKPFEEIAKMVEIFDKVLVLGCNECVTVCLAGGEKEVGVLATSLRLLRKQGDRPITTLEETITRQCEWEYLDQVEKLAEEADCIISMACGVGVQFVAERFPDKWVIPALNTKSAGGSVKHGVWEERCGLCGECILHKTGGVCPVARCSKRILNGPCGGSQNGKCEVKDVDCIWDQIYKRMMALGRMDQLMEIELEKDWSKARDGGPRRVVREDVMIYE